MTFPRSLARPAAWLALLASVACAPADPRSRIGSALDTLQSDAGGSRKSEACADLRSALAEYPHDAADRGQLANRAVPMLIGALRDPLSRREAADTLVAIGLPAYEPLFDAAVGADSATRQAATTCLVRMSATVVPVLLPSLLGDDDAAQERAVAVLTQMGPPISATLRDHHAMLLEPFAGPAGTTGASEAPVLSTRGRRGFLAFARVLGAIGDQTCVLALMQGCETLNRTYPDLGVAYLQVIQGLGPEAISRLPSVHQLAYERLRLTVGSP